jgi:PadR family transcriptional regulator AphA
MSIQYAILGLLSWRPAAGYDLKKLIADSSAFYWSGNNNQIYKSLLQLHAEGLVTSQVLHNDNTPTRKVYSITEAGLSALRKWILSAPQPPESRNTFLIQLAWADRLDDEELGGLIERYEHEVQMQLLMQREKARRGIPAPGRTPREVTLWNMIADNSVTNHESELKWIRRLRKELGLP